MAPEPMLSQAVDRPYHEPVPLVVARVALRHSDQIAVDAGDEVWTYAELVAAALTSAERLLRGGMRKGEAVGVAGPRGPGLIADLLAVLTAGGVAVPIDPDLPQRRRALMAREVGVERVLTGESCRDRIDPDLSVSAFKSLAERLTPDDAAYVFYTSGTTGVPNAVLGRHAGLSHFLDWQRKTFAIGHQDRCAQLTSLSFDVVLRDVFLPLTAGATLCVPAGGRTPAPEDALDWLAAQRITVVHAVPTLTQSWLAATTGSAEGESLRCVFFAGEPLPQAVVNSWRAAFPSTAHVVNLYGPTETTLAKCHYQVPDPPPTGIQPVGQPIPNTQVVVLAPDQRPCPDGVEGEIAVRTPFGTAGYINNPGLTQRRFVLNPFRDDPGDLLFLTGDRGRRKPDGTLHVLGRLDDQVKIRGVRIEPAEVSAALIGHPSVASAAVAAETGPDGTARLLAAVVPRPGLSVSGDDLRSALSEIVPTAMVPQWITVVDRLPMLPNGKLDRARLTTPRAPSPLVAGGIASTVAEIWSAVLESDIAAEDDFFALGGHSLHAATMLSRIRKALGVTVPMRTLFRHPTMAAFGKAVDEQIARAQPDVRDDGPVIPRTSRDYRPMPEPSPEGQ